MSKVNQKSRFKFSKRVIALLYVSAILFGSIIILLSSQFQDNPFLSMVIAVIGVAIIVSMSTIFLHHYFISTAQYSEMPAKNEKLTYELPDSKSDQFAPSSEIGIRNIYPKWSAFCEDILPGYVESIENSFVALGIGLSGLSLLFSKGKPRELINKLLKSKKEFLFCTVEPNSQAAYYRDYELEEKKSTSSTIQTSLTHLNNIKRANSPCNLSIKVLKNKFPKGSIICLDNKIIFYSPYLSAERTPTSWVIETHVTDDLYKKLQGDIEHLLKDAEEWPLS